MRKTDVPLANIKLRLFNGVPKRKTRRTTTLIRTIILYFLIGFLLTGRRSPSLIVLKFHSSAKEMWLFGGHILNTHLSTSNSTADFIFLRLTLQSWKSFFEVTAAWRKYIFMIQPPTRGSYGGGNGSKFPEKNIEINDTILQSLKRAC